MKIIEFHTPTHYTLFCCQLFIEPHLQHAAILFQKFLSVAQNENDGRRKSCASASGIQQIEILVSMKSVTNFKFGHEIRDR